jgi:deazaflavin-dependent oxidoreductase (nitroreductase family)
MRCTWREQNQVGTCPKKGSSTLYICDDHQMWWSSQQLLSSEKRKEIMAKKDKAPRYVRVANVMTTTLLRAGFKLVGPGMVFGNYPMYLLTVRGRKSGLPRTVPVAIIRRNGKRYVGSPYGIVDWVRNLRAAEEATLTRGRRSETVNATELPIEEAALVLREDVKDGNPFTRYFGVTADSSLGEFEQAVVSHPLFVLQSPLVQGQPQAEREERQFAKEEHPPQPAHPLS